MGGLGAKCQLTVRKSVRKPTNPSVSLSATAAILPMVTAVIGAVTEGIEPKNPKERRDCILYP
jgi:hypothetical protein